MIIITSFIIKVDKDVFQDIAYLNKKSIPTHLPSFRKTLETSSGHTFEIVASCYMEDGKIIKLDSVLLDTGPKGFMGKVEGRIDSENEINYLIEGTFFDKSINKVIIDNTESHSLSTYICDETKNPEEFSDKGKLRFSDFVDKNKYKSLSFA